jgi:hypothetical protein
VSTVDLIQVRCASACSNAAKGNPYPIANRDTNGTRTEPRHILRSLGVKTGGADVGWEGSWWGISDDCDCERGSKGGARNRSTSDRPPEG